MSGHRHARGAPGTRGRVLLREAVAATLAARVAAIVTALVVGGVCVAVLLTAGRSAATEASIARHIDDAGSRVVTLTDGKGAAGFEQGAVGRLARLSGVRWSVGFGLVHDVRPTAVGPGADPVAARDIFGSPPPALHLLSGRWPATGEAVVTRSGLAELHLAAAAGAVSDSIGTYPVVGVFAGDGPLTDVGAQVLIGTDPAGAAPLVTVVMLADRAEDVPSVAHASVAASGAEHPDALTVTTPAALAEVGRAVSGELGAFSRQLAMLITSAGALLIAITLFGSVSARRRDFGRRRALGAGRSALMVLVLVQAGLPAVAGAAIGSASGVLVVGLTTSHWPPAGFAVAAALLTVIAALVAAVPAALTASLRDPVQTLRVP